MKSSQSGCDTSTPPPSGAGRQTVLIVEANPLLRDTYWTQLIAAGHRGVTAHGKDVLDVMYAENASVVLLDLFTPDMDGVELLKSIKRISPETLVIAMGEEKPERDCLAVATELGADAFVRKPASAEAVMEALTRLTSQSAPINPTERRRYTRLAVDQKGYLQSPPDGERVACRVIDLSAGGALIKSEAQCPQGRPLILQVEGFGSFEGIVVRSHGGSTGFKFLMGELKRDRLKHALASFAKTGVAPIGTYGLVAHKPRRQNPEERETQPLFPFS